MIPLDSVEQHHWSPLPANVCTCVRGVSFPFPVAVIDPDCGRHGEEK